MDTSTPIPAPTPVAPVAPLMLVDVPKGASSDAFRASIANALNTMNVPPDKKAVLFQVQGDQTGTMTFGVGARFDDGWQVEGDIERRAGEPLAGQVNVVRIW
jgi:hypothetical protein